jgi:hypothetical protein
MSIYHPHPGVSKTVELKSVPKITIATEIAKSQDHLFLVAKKGNMIEIKNVIR